MWITTEFNPVALVATRSIDSKTVCTFLKLSKYLTHTCLPGTVSCYCSSPEHLRGSMTNLRPFPDDHISSTTKWLNTGKEHLTMMQCAVHSEKAALSHKDGLSQMRTWRLIWMRNTMRATMTKASRALSPVRRTRCCQLAIERSSHLLVTTDLFDNTCWKATTASWNQDKEGGAVQHSSLWASVASCLLWSYSE